jgi:hypothetical protein
VLAPNVKEENAAIYDVMKTTIQEFMNNRKWTDDDFELNERIECNVQITIENAVTQNQFEARIQIQSSRPVYNSDYKTPAFVVNDNNFNINFQPNTLIQFSLDQHRDQLSSILGFYAYYILGMDYDTFSPLGGTDYFLKAQQVVSNCQEAGSGWTASGSKNRYWLVENILSQSFSPLRDLAYTYHREGLDLLYTTPDDTRSSMAQQLATLRKVHQIRPSSYNMQLFFNAKSDEIINLFKQAPAEEKSALKDLLFIIDPGNITKYEQLK